MFITQKKELTDHDKKILETIAELKKKRQKQSGSDKSKKSKAVSSDPNGIRRAWRPKSGPASINKNLDAASGAASGSDGVLTGPPPANWRPISGPGAASDTK